MKKKILLIAPVFFGYYNEMIAELEKMDFEVTYICDAPSDSNFSKAIGRVNKKLIQISTEKYYKKNVLPAIYNKSFDFFLLIGGMTFAYTPEMICDIKKYNPNAMFIMYQWDSENNLPYSTYIHKYFDLLYSFDRNDCKDGKKYKFLPLFYTRAYERIGEEENSIYAYDCSYVGTAHPKKYKEINLMTESLKPIMPRQYIYHYMPSKLKYCYHKILSPEFKTAKYSEFQAEKLSVSNIIEIVRNSRCILDAPQSGQTGLTIRTIECIGAKKKIVTTNKDVINYDFYCPENILVYDGKVDYHSPFFKSEYIPLNDELYYKYSLRCWLKCMLGLS